MRKTILYIAMSLDGYIADKSGGVNWLGGDGSDEQAIGTYETFFETIDTILLGYKTYHQLVTELSPDHWPYAGKKCYVITHRNLNDEDGICFTSQTPADLIMQLKNESGKDIWICGGAAIINPLLDAGLIDRFHITVIPTILGDGVPLFAKRNQELKLTLVSTLHYNGMTDLVYEPR